MERHSISRRSHCIVGFERLLIARFIKQFEDVYTIKELGMDLLADNSDIKKAFVRRGEAFVKLKGVHYMEYHDNLLKCDNSGKLLKFRVPSFFLDPFLLFLLSS
jgi:hypothetical protein